MNNFNNWLRYLIFFLSMIGGDLAYAQLTIPKEDRVECLLQNGDKFVLILQYKWDPAARLFAHATSRYKSGGFNVWYQEKGKGKLIDLDEDIGYAYAKTHEVRGELCSRAGIYGGIINSPGGKQKLPSSTYFIGINLPFNMEILLRMERDDIEIKKQLDDLQATLFARGLSYGMAKGAMFSELPLQREICMNSDCRSPIVAVWQSFSKDLGKSWSDPIITKDSKLFVMGKTPYEQPGVAKPGKFKLGPR